MGLLLRLLRIKDDLPIVHFVWRVGEATVIDDLECDTMNLATGDSRVERSSLPWESLPRVLFSSLPNDMFRGDKPEYNAHS